MSFLSEIRIYVGRMREFERIDWAVYVAWVGLMVGLVLATGGFLLVASNLSLCAWWSNASGRSMLSSLLSTGPSQLNSFLRGGRIPSSPGL